MDEDVQRQRHTVTCCREEEEEQEDLVGIQSVQQGGRKPDLEEVWEPSP